MKPSTISTQGYHAERLLSLAVLSQQNECFRGRGGRSEENRQEGFRPAFIDNHTGEIYQSCFADGRPACFHLLDGLPADLIVSRDASGRVTAVKNTVIAGFVREGEFYTREQAAAAVTTH